MPNFNVPLTREIIIEKDTSCVQFLKIFLCFYVFVITFYLAVLSVRVLVVKQADLEANSFSISFILCC